MSDLDTYLQDGEIAVFAPGVDASITLNQTSDKMDHFLDIKDNAPHFVFISYNIFDDHMTYTDAESERVYLDRNEDNELELLSDAGEQGWRYYLAGFRPSAFGVGGLSGVILVHADAQKIKNFLMAKGKTWCVYGEKGGKAELWTF